MTDARHGVNERPFVDVLCHPDLCVHMSLTFASSSSLTLSTSMREMVSLDRSLFEVKLFAAARTCERALVPCAFPCCDDAASLRVREGIECFHLSVCADKTEKENASEKKRTQK